ncbi:MAG: DUF6055 domain-containing protein [Anaerolineae bacterium]|jgi:hypothetical protein|nr:DUF6055 domain-containing protein [Anaerolineae bacterium]
MRRFGILLILFMLGAMPALAESGITEYRGKIDEKTPTMRYPVKLEFGEGFIAIAEATSGDLDTQLFVYNAQDEILAHNDDRNREDYNSEVAFIANATDTYFLEITSYEATMGDYYLTVDIMPANQIQDNSRIGFSGMPTFYDTPNFRVHYTLGGADFVTEEYVKLVAQTMEEVYQLQVLGMGWKMPPSDSARGGDGRYDVYLIDLVNELDGGILGFARPENFERARGNAIRNTSASFLALDNNYELEDENPIPLMRSTAAHEFHHAIQFGYDDNEPHFWYYEATATWMEAVTFPSAQDATRYVEYVFDYPEICFGAQQNADPTGLLMYGTWMFMQSMADNYGYDSVRQLWENIALYDGWEPLIQTISAYDDNLIHAIARYHLQNIVRDYKYTPVFKEETVWLDSTITALGLWSHAGAGVQELGANYIELALINGIYDISLENTNQNELQLWALGVSGDVADVYDLGKGGTIIIKNYDHVYLMVMNNHYDDDLSYCEYATYQIHVGVGTSQPLAPAYQQFAEFFIPLVGQD